MPANRHPILATAATAALLCLPVSRAAAAGPLLFAPWALGHVIGAAARLATLPLVAASAAAAPQASYPPSVGYYPGASGYYGGGPGYYGGPPGYYAPANYYGRPPVNYAPPPRYYAAPQAYYRPALAYAPPIPRPYVMPRGYYAPRTPYSGSYGAYAFHRPAEFAYHRR